MISPGNSKMGALPSFSISTLSCDMIPGPDEQGCKKHCYAKRHIEIYPSAKASYLRNFEISQGPDFEALMIAEIQANKPLKKIGILRIHVAGDFYCQDYIDKWIRIAKANPTISFYAYTKAYNLDFSARPDNFVMKLSDDKDLWKSRQGDFDGVARVYDPTQACPAGFVPCGAQRVAGMTCAKCRLCTGKLGRKANVGFKRH